ncbi:uncharacterized protein [Ptychodera flava]|uniref:uncharacterized protein n=1 Tax=Ptychodera flava TaxID=63121 RepID=UPI00396A74C2
MGNSLLVSPSLPKVEVRENGGEDAPILQPWRRPRLKADWLVVKDEILAEELLEMKINEVEIGRYSYEMRAAKDGLDEMTDMLRAEQELLLKKLRRQELKDFFFKLHWLDKQDKTSAKSKRKRWVRALTEDEKVVHNWDPEKSETLEDLVSKLKQEHRRLRDEPLQGDDSEDSDESDFEWPTEQEDLLKARENIRRTRERKHRDTARQFLDGDVTLEEACRREVRLKQRAISRAEEEKALSDVLMRKSMNDHVKDLLDLVDPNDLYSPSRSRSQTGSVSEQDSQKASSPVEESTNQSRSSPESRKASGSNVRELPDESNDSLSRPKSKDGSVSDRGSNNASPPVGESADKPAYGKGSRNSPASRSSPESRTASGSNVRKSSVESTEQRSPSRPKSKDRSVSDRGSNNESPLVRESDDNPISGKGSRNSSASRSTPESRKASGSNARKSSIKSNEPRSPSSPKSKSGSVSDRKSNNKTPLAREAADKPVSGKGSRNSSASTKQSDRDSRSSSVREAREARTNSANKPKEAISTKGSRKTPRPRPRNSTSNQFLVQNGQRSCSTGQ